MLDQSIQYLPKYFSLDQSNANQQTNWVTLQIARHWNVIWPKKLCILMFVQISSLSLYLYKLSNSLNPHKNSFSFYFYTLKRWMDTSRNRPDAVCASPPPQKGKQVRDSTAFSGCKVKQKRAKKGARHWTNNWTGTVCTVMMWWEYYKIKVTNVRRRLN